MAETEKDQVERGGSAPPPEVKAEDQAARLRTQGVAPSPSTASGLAAMGSPEAEETAGDQAVGMDNWEAPGQLEPNPQNSAAQSSPALFTSNGSLPYQHVASPSGSVPASVIDNDRVRVESVKAAQNAAIQKRRPGHRRLSEATVSGLSRAELRAVATDRGYDVPERLSRRASVARFLGEQDKDDIAYDAPESEATLNAAPVPGVLAGGSPNPAPGKAAEAEDRVQAAMRASGEPIQQDKTADPAASERDEAETRPKGGPATAQGTRGGPSITPSPKK